jgi:hypothetical protein
MREGSGVKRGSGQLQFGHDPKIRSNPLKRLGRTHSLFGRPCFARMRCSGPFLGFLLASSAFLVERAWAGDSDVAKAIAEDNGDASESWGVQSGCSGCSFHQVAVGSTAAQLRAQQ